MFHRLIALRSLLFVTILGCLAAAVVSAQAPSPSPAISLTKDEQDWIAANPNIRLAPDPEFAPIEYFDQKGVYQGIAADNIKLLEQKLGIHFTIVKSANWDEVMVKLRNRGVDALGAIVSTPRRLTFMRITTPLFNVPGAIMVQNRVDPHLTFAKLKGMKVAVVSNFTAHDIIKTDYPEILLDVVPNAIAGLTKVSFGMVDAYVENLATATYYMQEAGISNLHIAGNTPFAYQWGIGIRMDWPELETIINKGIAAISEDERRAVLNRWLPLKQHWEPSRKFIMAVGAGLAGSFILVILISNWILRRQAAKKTAALDEEIYQHRQAEEEIRLLNANLEQRVAERTADLKAEITERLKAEEEKRKLQEQLAQSQKMEAIGLLAGGIAHDFNNILTAVIGYANLIRLDMAPDNRHRPSIDQILAASHRAVTLTQGLLAFSRKQIVNPQPIAVNKNLAKLEKILRRLIGEDIDFKVSYGKEPLVIMADASQLDQTVINLVTNARDAMPRGGSLLIKTSLAQLDQAFEHRNGFGKAGSYVLIEISDSGEGMSPEIQQRIFEPFFTTKGIGKGTGLGLATVYGIVNQSEGYITCFSKPGEGTTFRLSFPLLRESALVPEKTQDDIPIKGGSETILFAEDSQPVRSLYSEMLSHFGYQVITAADGPEALEQFRENQERIDLVILDVIMPRMNGKEVFDAINTIRPGMRVLFSSGYTAEIIHQRSVLNTKYPFIAKPATAQQFLQKVREVLDTAPPVTA